MKSNPNSYKDLVVWQKGIALAKTVYSPNEEFSTGREVWINCADATRGDIGTCEYRRRSGATHHRRIHPIYITRRRFGRGARYAIDSQHRTRILPGLLWGNGL